MACEVEYSDEFGAWWASLTDDEQDSVDYAVSLLEEFGTDLKRPYVDTIHGSIFANMREFVS